MSDKQILELGSREINDACWAILGQFKKDGVEINGHAFNHLKAGFYAGYLKLKELEQD